MAFDGDDAYVARGLAAHGVMPLPPYIKRPAEGQAEDRDSYQTVFAARDGAVAAPTASLHFTPTLVEAIRARGVEIVHVTLHVGAGTFLPVKVEDLSQHVMHSEWGEVSAEAAARINACQGRVVARRHYGFAPDRERGGGRRPAGALDRRYRSVHPGLATASSGLKRY